jgi:hypothetical protein
MNKPPNINSEAADQIHSATIQIARLEKGAILFVETEDAIYELTVLTPEQSVVRVNTNDKRFLEIPNVVIDTPIVWGDCMRMATNGTVLFSKKVNGASVKGDGWEYDVL